MDLSNRIKLFLSPIKKHNRKIIHAILSTTDTGSYAIPGYALVIARRQSLDQPLRGVIRNADTPRGLVIGPASIELMDQNQTEAIEIMKFLIKWNEYIKEKHASRYKEARRNGGPRSRGRSN